MTTGKTAKSAVLSIVSAFACAAALATGDVIANKPYADGLGGSDSGVYRIPAMAKSTNGVIVAVSDCRYNNSGDLPNAIDIAECWSGDNGATWSAPRIGIDVENTNYYVKACNIGDPCMLYDPAGDRFWLMAITGGGLASSHDSSGNSRSDVVLYTRGTSVDDAWQEWTGGPEGNARSVKQAILDALAEVEGNQSLADERLIRGILQGPGHGIAQRRTVYAADGETVLMPEGALVFPMQYFPKTADWAHESRTFAVYSTDGGETWKSTRLTPDGIIAQENCIMELDDGSWLMIAKGTSRQRFRTKDFVNWFHAGSHLPSEWVQGSCLRIGEGMDGRGRYAACFSPAGRNNVTLYFGIDTTTLDADGTGVKWNLGERVVYPGSTGGMGYNSLVMLDETTLGVLVEASGHIYLVKEDIRGILDSAGAIMTPPTPVAVWRGGFSSKHNGVALNLNGHASGGEGITIQDESDNPSGQGYKGVDVDFDSARTGGMTVLFKYSGLSVADTNQVLATSCVSAEHSSDRTGVRLLPDGTLNGCWNSNTSSGSLSSYGTAWGEICGSGCMAFAYKGGGSQVAGHGTVLYQSNADGIAFSQAWGAERLVASGDSSSHWGATIGGSRGKTQGWSAAHGMTIEAIAVFDRPLSTDELDSFEWPRAADVSAASISLNFHDGNELDSTGTAVLGVAGYGVPQNLWNSLVATNNATLSQLKCTQSSGEVTTLNGVSATITGTRGHYNCGGLSSVSNILHGYMDDNDKYTTPTVTVTGVPYDKYRVVVYHSTDTKNISFGYDLVNGIPFTGVSGHTSVGTMRWGDTGPSNSANAIEEGVNTLVTPILNNNAEKTLTVTGHRISSSVARGCIAAIQIFDASDEDEDLANATNRFATVLYPSEWQFPEDVVVADPSGFGGIIIGTNGISHAFMSTEGYVNTAISVLAAIPESTAGTLVALGVKGSNDVQVKYNGDGTFFLTYNGMASGGETVTSRKVDVSGVHAYTLSYRSQHGTTLYQDDVPIATASGIKWNSKGAMGSTDIGMRHGGGDVLSGLTVYAAYTHYWTTDNTAGNLFDTFSHPVFDDESATLAKKAEVFSHLAGYGDTDGLLALMPHRTSTYEHGSWHCPLDATLADGEYVDGLEITRDAVEQLLPGVVTNAACASVLAEIPANASGVIANFSLVDGSSTHYAFAHANGDGTVSLGWEGGVKFKTSASLTDWSLPHVWTFVNDVSGQGRLYRDDTLVVEATGLKFNNHKFASSVTFGDTPNGKYPLVGMKVYAVHTDFGSSSAIFDKAEDNAASVFDTFDFMSEQPEDATLDEKLAGFALYSESGVAYEPPPAFDPETDEVADECVLRISEIMPKPTDAQDRGKLEGMDVNGLESGWVEVENTSDKWAELGDYRFIRVNRGKKTDPAGVGNFPSRLVPPHSRAIFYTSERYSNSKDKAVSAFEHGTFDGRPMVMGDEFHNVLVWGDKVNPKKSPYVRLYYAPGGDSDKGTVVDTVVVPSDLPEGWSIIVGDAADDEGTRRWMCPTPTRGRENSATDGLKRIGPNVGPLYEKKGQKKTDFANEFATPVPPAVPGTDYTVTLPINAVMNPDGTFTPRTADQIQSLKFVYRKDLDDTTLVTNVIEMATKNTVENWGDQYTATIPASYFPEAGHLMQWKVLITDGEGVEWTSPSFNNPDDGYEWYGTIVEPGELNSATLPTWHMFASGNHLTQMDKDKDDQNLSLVPNYARIAIYDSSTSNYYDYVRIDLRGHTSANFTKKGHGLRFAKAHPLTMVDSVTGETIEEIRKTSLISEFADPSYMRQMIAFWLWRKMGNLVPFDFPVRCNLNGEFYQLAFNSERFTDELIEDVYGLDKFGYSWKNVGTMKSGPKNDNTYGTSAGGAEKKTPDDEDEKNVDVLEDELRSSLKQYGAQSNGEDMEELTKFVVEKYDLPAWLNYLASARITHEMDDVWANVCAYYDNPDMKEGVRGTGTWMPLGYDFNLSFGQYYQDSSVYVGTLMSNQDWFKSHPFYGGNRVRCYTSEARTGTINYGNDGFEAVLQSAKFRRLYLRRLRTLMDQELKEPGVSADKVPFVAEMRRMADLMRDDAALDLEKWPDGGSDDVIDSWRNGTRPENMDAGIQDIWDNYVVPRREHLYVTHSVTNAAKAIGYGSNLNAGIPEAQSPIATLAPNIVLAKLSDCVVVSNLNDEVVDMSGWTLRFGAEWTLPPGTVCDSNDCIYVVADRRAYVADHDGELTDQVIVGNAEFSGLEAVFLESADGTTLKGCSAEDGGVVVFDAKNQNKANEMASEIPLQLSTEDVAAGLDAQYLKVVAEPVAGEAGKYKAVVVVNPDTVAAPVVAAGESAAEGEPVKVEDDEEGKKTVSASISNAVIGLWYGYEVADELGANPVFNNDVGSFERAKGAAHTIKGSPRTESSGFFRVKVLPAKPVVCQSKRNLERVNESLAVCLPSESR